MTMQATRDNDLDTLRFDVTGFYGVLDRKGEVATGQATVPIEAPETASGSKGIYAGAELSHSVGHPSLSSVLAEAAGLGDEVIYIARASWYAEVIRASGAEPVRVNFDSAPCTEIAAFLGAITPRTRAVVLGSEESSGRSLLRDVLATLMRLLTTASNIFGRPVYLISDEDEKESPLERPEYSSVSDLYPYTVVSTSSYTARALGVINHF